MISERFDVVVVPFPFVDAPKTKPRPAQVLTARSFNRANRHTVLAMITRAPHTRWPSDHPIADLGPTGLRHPSIVRWKIFTLDNRIIERRIGVLDAADRADCNALLAGALGLAPPPDQSR
jgi:mRNA interferase MazF